MSSAVRAVVVLALAVALMACSGGGGQASAPTTTTTRPATTQPTPTTRSQEDEVKQAWDDYWAMMVRLGGAPDPGDAELPTRVVDPLLSFLKDDLGTRAAKGERVVIPPGAQYAHRFLSAAVSAGNATVAGCQLDDAVTVGQDGAVLDNAVLTKDLRATFVRQNGAWLVKQVEITAQTQGLVGCGS